MTKLDEALSKYFGAAQPFTEESELLSECAMCCLFKLHRNVCVERSFKDVSVLSPSKSDHKRKAPGRVRIAVSR